MRDSSDEITLSPRFVGGTHVTFAASEIVRIYLETGSYMKSTFDDDIDCQARNCGFRFNTVAFGKVHQSEICPRKTCLRQVLEPQLPIPINGGVFIPVPLPVI